MIYLKKVRLINWYGFGNTTMPIGLFTLIAGRNGNGKSVILDAIKYAAYGDTVFNKSTENKSTRTLPSYTRGLMDATAKTYMRPADKIPNVYSHIVLEYYDADNRKSFLLGTILETNASNNVVPYRYVMDRTEMGQVEHLYVDQGGKKPYDSSLFQKKYGVTLLNREQGIVKFMQMTGLKLNMEQTRTYLRKLRGIMTYNPDAKIDQFIRESVLENKPVDFSKLIDAKENIDRLNGTFDGIQKEIEELEGILREYDGYETEKMRLLIDDIKIVYKSIGEKRTAIDSWTKERELAATEQKRAEAQIIEFSEQEREQNLKLQEVLLSLRQMDCMKPIQIEEENLRSLEKEKSRLGEERKRLEVFQRQVSELMYGLTEIGCEIGKREILASLEGTQYSFAEKRSAVTEFKRLLESAHDRLVAEAARLADRLKGIDNRMLEQLQILEDCKKNRNDFRQIPESVNLKREINREFAKRGISSEAKFACEYVIGLKDEAWRDAIEAFLGNRRFSILVEPKYYDVADEILNCSAYRYAHLFNTKLLMKKKVEAESESVIQFLEIRNEVAKKYFEYQLGRMRAAALDEVKFYENAISKEGRVSVGMDGYFLRFERIHFYALGQETLELNRIRAEREYEKLQSEKQELTENEKRLTKQKGQLAAGREEFGEYVYDVNEQYQEILKQIRESEKLLEKLREAQAHDQEFVTLNDYRERLEQSLSQLRESQNKARELQNHCQSVISKCADQIEETERELKQEEIKFHEYQLMEYAAVQKATRDYDRYLENGKTGQGGLIVPDTRRRIRSEIDRHSKEILILSGEYNGKRSEESRLPSGLEYRTAYEQRKSKIWMDDLQEIKQRLEDQTRRYEDIFKNEFVLTIFRSCNKSIEDLKLINAELAKLKFTTRYQFDVHYNKDASDYARIIDYARYLDEKEQFGGGDGQLILGMFSSYSQEEAEHLERDIKGIINRMILKNNQDAIERFADYRNYMTYEILLTNETLKNARLSKQTGYNSGAEVQIPYLLILSSALLMIYNQKVNSTRLMFIDEPFAKMDPANVKRMLEFLKNQNLQVVFCAPDKTESIGNECEVILPVLRVKTDFMQLGIVQFHKDKENGL